MVSVRKSYVNARFGQVHLRTARPTTNTQRTPLMCFHSSPNSGRLFETLAAEMGRDRMCLAPDTPGFGYSDPPHRAPSIEDYAGTMEDVVRALDIPSIDLLGYHTGSEISVALAQRLPTIVRRLAIVSAPIFTEEELAGHRAHYAQWTLSEDGSHLAEKWSAHLYWAGPGVSKEHVAVQFSDPMRRPDISWWGHNAAFDYPMSSQMAQVGQPILVLNPEDDLHEQTQRARGLSNNIRVRELPGWGHGFLEIHTVEATGILREFFDGDPT